MDVRPQFTDEELRRRRNAIDASLGAHDLDAVLVYGANRAGSAVDWLTGWPVTREAALLVRPGDPYRLFVQFYNHVPNARRFARDTEVEWGGPSTIASVARTVVAAGVARLGVIGPLGWSAAAKLMEAGVQLVDLGPDYTLLRMYKSDEELAWMRTGAELSDLASAAVRNAARPGVTDSELGAACEAAYLAHGATNQIHYFGVTNMDAPDCCVPAQWPSGRRLVAGDVIVSEISASWWGYAGQVLRTMAVGAAPSRLYQELHDVADAAYDAICAVLRPGGTPAEVVEAAAIIEDAGFSIYDDLVHGYGGGYLPPIIGSRSRMNEPLPDLTFAAGMTVVVQPNVITPDERAGVQTGGLIAITETGAEELQHAPRGFWRAG